MNYTNLDNRLKLYSLSPAFVRRLERVRAASLKARSASDAKKAAAAAPAEAEAS